ncbi:MAG: DoxX family protein [Actinomycetota bacterium]|nr:DoxX family protein [Actinomycetota bacterium]
MFVVAAIVSIVYAAMLLGSAAGKLTKQPQVVQGLTSVGVKTEQFPYLTALLVAAAAGLIIGLWWAPIGIAAAVGATLYFALALAAHARAKVGHYAAPGAYFAGAVVALILRILSA